MMCPRYDEAMSKQSLHPITTNDTTSMNNKKINHILLSNIMFYDMITIADKMHGGSGGT